MEVSRCRHANVVLTEHQETLIEMLVQSGRYQNASEVLREGLRLVENREVEEATKLETLRAAAQLGGSALEARRVQRIPNGLALLASPQQDRQQSRLRHGGQLTGT